MNLQGTKNAAINEEYDRLFHTCEAKQQVLDQLEALARRYDTENEVNSRVLARQFIKIIEGANGT